MSGCSSTLATSTSTGESTAATSSTSAFGSVTVKKMSLLSVALVFKKLHGEIATKKR